MKHRIKSATHDDRDSILALLPRLAEFDIPKHRAPKELWEGDANMVKQWSDGKRPELDIWVACKQQAVESDTADDSVIGVSIVSYKPELLSSKPSAHLEVMVVDKAVEGQGVASALIKHAQKMAAAKGAQSMSLHVFAANQNARTFYEKQGFDGELLRYSKPLKVKKVHNFFGKHVATSGVARSIKKLLRSN